MKFPRFIVTAALGVSMAFGSFVPLAHAQDQAPTKTEEAVVSAEITILHATNDNTGIDPKIGKMPELGKPPFSSYNSYSLLDRVKVPLGKGKSAKLKLPNARELMVALKDVIEAKKKDEVRKYVLSASIQKASGSAFLPLLEVNAKAGETFFVAGQTHKGGVLVIGIKIVQ